MCRKARIADNAATRGLTFHLETGQESAAALVRFLQEVDRPNVGVNFDVANLILYGKANPVDAVDLLAPYLQGVHAKDGRYPTSPDRLGEEVPIGEGQVNFPVLI